MQRVIWGNDKRPITSLLKCLIVSEKYNPGDIPDNGEQEIAACALFHVFLYQIRPGMLVWVKFSQGSTSKNCDLVKVGEGGRETAESWQLFWQRICGRKRHLVFHLDYIRLGRNFNQMAAQALLRFLCCLDKMLVFVCIHPFQKICVISAAGNEPLMWCNVLCQTTASSTIIHETFNVLFEAQVHTSNIS